MIGELIVMFQALIMDYISLMIKHWDRSRSSAESLFSQMQIGHDLIFNQTLMAKERV